MDQITRAHALLSDTKLSRNALTGQTSAAARTVRIDVLRNHSFELVASTVDAFLALSGLRSEIHYSDYDDSFSEAEPSENSELTLIWVDLDRYDAVGRALVLDRFGEVAERTDRPVLFAPVSSDPDIAKTLAMVSPRLRLIDIISIRDQLGTAFFDERLAEFTGSRCSPRACLEASRLIGARAIPAAIQPALKAIVVDLDNTLYAGVLGEDGVDGIALTPGHSALQRMIENLAQQGLFVCVVSKNEERDAVELFEKRTDFPLKRASITKLIANWDAKPDNIATLERVLNIHHSAMVFLDDNMGELFEVRRALPEINVLWASPDAEANARALALYPGLERDGPTSAEDRIRSRDVQANEERRRRQVEMSHEEYLRSLEVTMDFRVDRLDDAVRITDLSNKTNQFIFNYGRYAAAEIDRLIASPEACVVTVRMSDKLIDSGIIGVAVVKRCGETIFADDVFVSCRALGRGLDEVIVLGLLSIAQARLGLDLPLQVAFKIGPRNGPAKSFVDAHLAGHVGQAQPFIYNFPKIPVRIITSQEEQ